MSTDVSGAQQAQRAASDREESVSLASSPPCPTMDKTEASMEEPTEPNSAEIMPPPAVPASATQNLSVSRKRSHESVEDYSRPTEQDTRGESESDYSRSEPRRSRRRNSTDTITTTKNTPQEGEGGNEEQLPVSSHNSQRPPQSGQGSIAPKAGRQRRGKSKPNKRKVRKDAALRDRTTDDESAMADDDNDSPSDSDLSERPERSLEDFNWDDLCQRYHDKIKKVSIGQAEVMKEFAHLLEYFQAWAIVGDRRETTRSFKRLKTQMTYVEHEEGLLEKKRQHYVQVVEAFKTVSDLLGMPDWHQRIVPTRRRFSGIRSSLGKDASNQVARRDRLSTVILQLEEWAHHIVDDIDMAKYHVEDHHAARCVIL